MCTTRRCWPGAAARSGSRRLGRYSPSAGGATASYGNGPPFTPVAEVEAAPWGVEEPMAPHLDRAVGLQPPSSDRRPEDSSCAQPRALKREQAQSPWHRLPLSADRREPAGDGAPNPRHLRTRRSVHRDRAHGEETFRGPCQKKPCQLIAATPSHLKLVFLGGILVSLGEMRLGKTLRTLRSRRGWTQVALAKKARITQGYLARVEAGTRTPTLPMLKPLARALGATLGRLVG